ncbi:DNA-methyltransferase [Chryseobacterium sp.]|uniref:DNA-methyltransferase n=1 Tax=Chryseobacterium sp. TaxID=1871047 RepID=UPI002FC60442
MEDCSIDLTVTSPPYDNLRTYNGYSFDFESVAKELYRVTKDGGVVVWVVGDETVSGSETLTSFRQALYFKDLGFNVETMIWEKPTFTATGALKYRYGQVFEYMFVLSKGFPKHFNPIKDRKNSCYGEKIHSNIRQIDGSFRDKSSIGKPIAEFGQRFNVWECDTCRKKSERLHPAPFPEKLVNDHIISWSNVGDVVFDPFVGSGTTSKMAKLNGRNYIGCDCSQEYIDIANERCM